MNAEMANRWCKALRSGEFVQGEGQLRTLDNKYCCLGVLCELDSRDTDTAWELYTGPNPFKPTTTEGHQYLGAAYILPSSIAAKYGLNLDDLGNLSSMNDRGISFEEIADFIEKKIQ